jgi:hypothetical protein
VALVQFANFTTIRSASGRSVYTEVTMNVEQVLKDPSGTVQRGKALPVALGGGTLRLPSGRILQWSLRLGDDDGIEPGHRYVAFLHYQKEGEYFEWMKSWDVSSGVAVPTDPCDIRKAKEGTSGFAGMSEDNFVAAVKGILSAAAAARVP